MAKSSQRKQASASKVPASEWVVIDSAVAVSTPVKKLASSTYKLNLKGSSVTITSADGMVTVDLSRRKLVGKYPEVKHRPAPKSKLRLDNETRTALLASMVLN